MRILHVTSARNFGGGEKHLTDLCRGLKDRGHEIFAAVRARENLWRDRLDFLPDERILQIPLKNSLDVFSAAKLAKSARLEKIEIIHAHLARDYPLAALAARFYPEAKFVLTRHVLFPLKKVHKILLGNLDRAIAVSAPVAETLREIFPPEKIALIPNGIDIETFSGGARDFSGESENELGRDFRFQNDISFDARLVVTVGELKTLKGQEDFVIAANEIARKNPSAHFLIVGRDHSFDQSFRRKLKRLVRVFQIEDRFTFLEWVEDTRPLLAAADCFVSASHTESFGLAILEAMAAGTAIAATETEGAAQLIENDFSGKLVPLKNPLALAEAVDEILSNEAASRLFGRNAQKFAAENFDSKIMIDRTEALYRSILS